MKDDKVVPSKKFLYNDYKKGKNEKQEMQFHSKGFNPGEKSSLIDLDSIWSLKDITLETSSKSPDHDVLSHAGSTYYSRYGKYKNTNTGSNSGAQSINNANAQQGSQWNRKTFDNSMQKNLYQSPGSDINPLDF